MPRKPPGPVAAPTPCCAHADPNSPADHYIAAQPAPRRRGDSPRAAARLAQRRARRGQRVQPAIHTVMKITQRHLARIYGSALRCGVSPAAAEARINMLLREAHDEGFGAALDASCSDTERASDRGSDADRMSADDVPRVARRAACSPTAAPRRHFGPRKFDRRRFDRQSSVEVSSACMEGRGAQDTAHGHHACGVPEGGAAGERAVRRRGVLRLEQQLADGMAGLNVSPGRGEEGASGFAPA